MQEASSGEEAISIWRQWQPHLIWMDKRMPRMDGLEATRQILLGLQSLNRRGYGHRAAWAVFAWPAAES